MQPTSYHCFFTNGQKYKATTLAEASALPKVEYIVKQDYVKHFQSQVHSYAIFKYQLIDNDGLPRQLLTGTFKLLSIGEDVQSNANYASREVLIQNLTNQQVHSYTITGFWPAFFTDGVLPLLEELNRYGSYEAYQQSFEVKNLKNRITYLEGEISRLKEQLNQVSG